MAYVAKLYKSPDDIGAIYKTDGRLNRVNAETAVLDYIAKTNSRGAGIIGYKIFRIVWPGDYMAAGIYKTVGSN